MIMQRGGESADLLMVRGDSNDGVLMAQGETLPRFGSSLNDSYPGEGGSGSVLLQWVDSDNLLVHSHALAIWEYRVMAYGNARSPSIKGGQL